MTVFDRWLENRPSNTGFPSIGLPGLGSDYAPFTHLTGLNIIDVGFSQSSRVLRSSYSTYHTGYDDFNYIDKFIDPGFRYVFGVYKKHKIYFSRASKKVTEVTAGMIIRAADFSDFPVNASPFVKYLNDYLANLENSAIPPKLMTGQLDAIRQSKNMYVFLYICPIFV